LAKAPQLAGSSGVHGLGVLHGSVQGLRHLAAMDAAGAVAALEATGEVAERFGVGNPVLAPWESDLVEAYRLAGHPERAREQLERLAGRAGDLPTTLAAVARHRAVLAGDPAAARTWFREAMRGYARQPRPFEQARTELAYAERLLRDGSVAEALPLLSEAATGFRRLGAAPFAARTLRILDRAGASHGPDRTAELDRLTPRELQVARAVADGLSNPEAAAALFVSRKTVETHLSSTYRKLGVRSRTQLVRYLAEAGLSGSSPMAERS
jgi:DNA-binding NarL/FixJ family response regulator